MSGGWNRRQGTAIAVGGAVGAGLRWAVLTSVASGRFPWPVFAINVVGSVLLGILLAEEWPHPSARLLLHDFGGIGFCGGLTTFSTFAVEIVNLARDGDARLAVIYTVASVAAAMTGVIAGAGVVRLIRSASVPLEGEGR